MEAPSPKRIATASEMLADTSARRRIWIANTTGSVKSGEDVMTIQMMIVIAEGDARRTKTVAAETVEMTVEAIVETTVGMIAGMIVGMIAGIGTTVGMTVGIGTTVGVQGEGMTTAATGATNRIDAFTRTATSNFSK